MRMRGSSRSEYYNILIGGVCCVPNSSVDNKRPSYDDDNGFSP